MATHPGIFLGKALEPQSLSLRRANRHGLIAGATGTGKTVSLRLVTEGFSRAGVPVFLADVKGDLSGMCAPGVAASTLEERARNVGLDDYGYGGFPVIFWDLYGEQGHPVRATVADMGPLLLARMLGLNEVQEGILNVAFAVSDAEDLPLLDLKDLRAMLNYVAENARQLRERYGNISKQSVGAIQRRLLGLEQQGAEAFFGEPELELADLMRIDRNGHGYISILRAERLIRTSPNLYASFLFWLLSRLFEQLPEIGDPEKPRLVFFFDEAHLLLDDAPKALVDKVEQVVRLIRSKGVGVYLVTQSPLDIPVDILGQLGNRIQHGLRAFTPKDQKAVRAAAQTFRANPSFDAAEAIQELMVGEALVSTLDEKGAPTVVERTLIAPPKSQLGPASADDIQRVLDDSPVLGKYDVLLDRESAHEHLEARRRAEAEQALKRGDDAPERGAGRSGRRRQGIVEAMTKSAARSIASTIGRQIARTVMRALFGNRR